MARLILVGKGAGPLQRHVIFVHGLTGHAYDTWRSAPGFDSFWPAWLGAEIPRSCIWTVSYFAPATNWFGGTMPLNDRATNIAELLVAEKFDQGKLTFICHSLGGLIVKQIMVVLNQRSKSDPRASALLGKVDGVVFLATPHSGSRQAGFLHMMRLLAWPSTVAANLVENSEGLRTTNNAYRELIQEHDRNIRHQVFFETRDTLMGRIVSENSSDPGLPGGAPIPLDEDHISICKPTDRESLLYRSVVEFIGSERRGHSANFELHPEVPVSNRVAFAQGLFPFALRIFLLLLVFTVLGFAFKGFFTSSSSTVSSLVEVLVSDAAKRKVMEAQLAEVTQKYSLQNDAVNSYLKLLEDKSVPADQILDRFKQLAADHLALRKSLTDFEASTGDQDLLISRAKDLLEKGDTKEARSLLEKRQLQLREALARSQFAVEKQASASVQISRAQAGLALQNYEFEEAGGYYEEAAQIAVDLKSKFINLSDAAEQLRQVRFSSTAALRATTILLKAAEIALSIQDDIGWARTVITLRTVSNDCEECKELLHQKNYVEDTKRLSEIVGSANDELLSVDFALLDIQLHPPVTLKSADIAAWRQDQLSKSIALRDRIFAWPDSRQFRLLSSHIAGQMIYLGDSRRDAKQIREALVQLGTQSNIDRNDYIKEVWRSIGLRILADIERNPAYIDQANAIASTRLLEATTVKDVQAIGSLNRTLADNYWKKALLVSSSVDAQISLRHYDSVRVAWNEATYPDGWAGVFVSKLEAEAHFAAAHIPIDSADNCQTAESLRVEKFVSAADDEILHIRLLNRLAVHCALQVDKFKDHRARERILYALKAAGYFRSLAQLVVSIFARPSRSQRIEDRLLESGIKQDSVPVFSAVIAEINKFTSACGGNKPTESEWCLVRADGIVRSLKQTTQTGKL